MWLVDQSTSDSHQTTKLSLLTERQKPESPADLSLHTEADAPAMEKDQPKGPQDTESNSTAVAGSSTSVSQDNDDIDLESNIFLYRDSHIYRIGTVLGTLLSSLIPIAAIVVLSFVKDMTARLGIVSAFTGIFSVSLSLVTEGKRVEIFAATAA